MVNETGTAAHSTRSRPVVAVIVPAFNAETFLEQTLASVSSQTDPGWQCVVVDDGSTDDTARIAARFEHEDQRFTLVRQPNQGVASARNHGLRQTDSEFVMFLDADDVLEPDALELLRKVLTVEHHAPAVHGRASVIDRLGAQSDLCGYEQTFGRQRLVPRRYWPMPRTKFDKPMFPITSSGSSLGKMNNRTASSCIACSTF